MLRGIHWGRLTAAIVGSLLIALFCRYRFGSDWFEVAGFVTGIVAVYLVTEEHVANWPIGILNVLLYAYVFWQARLYADMSLQFFFFALSVHGWYSWVRGGSGHSELRVSRLIATHWALVLGVVAIGTALYKPVIEHYKGAQPFWDTLLTMVSVVAQVLLNRKVVENWILWIVADLCYIPLYLSRNLYPTAILYGVFLVLAVRGLVEWNRTWRATQVETPVSCAQS